MRTPDFNPVRQAGNLPIVRALRGKTNLPASRQLPQGELSPMPEIQRPAPTPLPQGEAPPWRPPLVDPNQESMPAGWRPPMSRPINLPRPAMTPIPMSDAMPSRALSRPIMQGLPDIPQLPGRPGPAVPDNPIDRARYDYVMQGAKRNPDGTLAGDKVQFGRSGKQIALGALTGLQRGGILGALTGGLTNVISPMTGREQNFEALYRPGLEQQAARQQAADDRQRQLALQDLNMRRGQVALDQETAQTELYKAQAQKALNPAIRPEDPRRNVFNTPRGTLDLSTGQIIQGTEPLSRERNLSPTQQLAEGEIEREASEGTPEQIADDSYQGRGGDAYVISKLPADVQEILTKGTVRGERAYPDEIDRAQRMFERAAEQEKKSILSYTKGEARKKASRRVVGKKGGTPSATGTRSLRELEQKYFGGQ